ncbi:hypothetical protein D3C80_1697190 [compost metagenome]
MGLVDLGNWRLSELRQDMKFKRAEPSPSFPVALQFSLPAFECIGGHVFEEVKALYCFPLVFFALANRIESRPRNRTPTFRFFAGFLQ